MQTNGVNGWKQILYMLEPDHLDPTKNDFSIPSSQMEAQLEGIDQGESKDWTKCWKSGASKGLR